MKDPAITLKIEGWPWYLLVVGLVIWFGSCVSTCAAGSVWVWMQVL